MTTNKEEVNHPILPLSMPIQFPCFIFVIDFIANLCCSLSFFFYQNRSLSRARRFLLCVLLTYSVQDITVPYLMHNTHLLNKFTHRVYNLKEGNGLDYSSTIDVISLILSVTQVLILLKQNANFSINKEFHSLSPAIQTHHQFPYNPNPQPFNLFLKTALVQGMRSCH